MKTKNIKNGLIKISIAFSIMALLSVFLVAQISASPVSKQPPASFSELVKKASPSVVYISTEKIIEQRRQFRSPFGQNDPFGDFFDRFFGDRYPGNRFPQKATALGTGFIIDKEGYIFTNNHVIERADTITVTLEDKREFTARIIGKDPKTDIALIKIDDAGDLTSLNLGNSDDLEVGDWVVAIGNPFGLFHTVTAGIVSAKYRDLGGPYDNFIQTDASINQGNSGGPLMNTNGEVIGINSAIFSQTGGNIGIGFAIPINMAKDLLPQLKKGKIERGWLGVGIQEINPALKEKLDLKDEKGALVSHVEEGGPADKAGIKRDDVIISFDGKEIKEYKDLPYIVSSTPVGKKVKVEVLRNGKKKTFTVKIEELVGDEESQTMMGGGGDIAGPDLGRVVHELTPEIAQRYGISDTKGLIVLQVQYNSPAAEAGLREGDIILEIDREPVENVRQFNSKIKDYKAGDTILFLVKHEDMTVYVTLKVPE